MNYRRLYTEHVKTDAAQLPSTASSVLIAQLGRGLRPRIEQAIAPIGLRPRELLALQHLRERGPSAQQTLAELLRVDPSNLVGVLNDLEDAGLIVRSRDRADRRRGIIELTDEGGRVLQELDRALHGIDDDVLSVLSERERATLNGLLARAVEAAAVQCAEQPEPGC
jgi:DNA-binding MarR family transcriptional regulator